MEAFAADVARLRDDVERLAKRIDLQSRRQP
jgi:ubiquinone biosynthesis protein UbiJ